MNNKTEELVKKIEELGNSLAMKTTILTSLIVVFFLFVMGFLYFLE